MSPAKAFVAGWVSGIAVLVAVLAGFLTAYGRIVEGAPARNVTPEDGGS